jgi:hypothetical protein
VQVCPCSANDRVTEFRSDRRTGLGSLVGGGGHGCQFRWGLANANEKSGDFIFSP